MNKRKSPKRKNIGGLVGSSKGGKIENCYSSVKIKVNGKENINVGGLVGSSENTEINGSSSKATIEITDDLKFEEIKKAIQDKIEDAKIIKSLLTQVEEMKAARNTKSYTSKFKKFISTASDYMSIIGPFIPFLTNYIEL